MRSQLPVVIEDGPEGFGSQWDGLEPWDLSVVPLQRTNRLFSTVQSELFFFSKNDSSDRCQTTQQNLAEMILVTQLGTLLRAGQGLFATST